MKHKSQNTIQYSIHTHTQRVIKVDARSIIERERERTCIVDPTGRVVLGEGEEAVVVLVVEFHLALGAVKDLTVGLLEVPLGELVEGDEPIGGVHVDLREEEDKPVGHVELVLVVQKVLRVHILLPLRLRLVTRCRVI